MTFVTTDSGLQLRFVSMAGEQKFDGFDWSGDKGPEVEVRPFSFTGPKGGYWRCVKVRCGDRLMEMYVSPTGRSIRCFIDGEEVDP